MKAALQGVGLTAMDGWHFALYVFAVYLAIRTLVGLMRVHEQDLRRTQAAEAAERPAQKVPQGR